MKIRSSPYLRTHLDRAILGEEVRKYSQEFK